MFATSISSSRATAARALAAAALCLAAGLAVADTNQISSATNAAFASFSVRADQDFRAARKKFLADTNDAPTAWQFGRACFDLADLATNNATKAEIAEQGIAACRRSLACDPKIAAAHYYLGMAIGQLADTKRNLAGLKMVKEMEREFNTARELDEHFDFAGPDRNLGMLYFQTPSFVSIGSRPKARQHMQRAVELAPDYPENHLNLVELYVKLANHEDARNELKIMEKIWPAAKAKLAGDTWALAWRDWDQRLATVKKKIADAGK